MNKQKECLRQIQELGFVLVELNLFLDTHPDDKQARDLYNKYSEELDSLRKKYNEMFGPTMNFGLCPTGDSFSWINSPWPWEN